MVDKSKSFASNEKYIYITFYPIYSNPRKRYRLIRKDVALPMERINSRNVRATFEFESGFQTARNSPPRVGLPRAYIYGTAVCIPVDPFADSHREFLATFGQGGRRKEGEGARRDYIGMDCA